jgi:hypothetical protein
VLDAVLFPPRPLLADAAAAAALLQIALFVLRIARCCTAAPAVLLQYFQLQLELLLNFLLLFLLLLSVLLLHLLLPLLLDLLL